LKSLIQYLRGEGVELFETPEMPIIVDTSLHSTMHKGDIERENKKNSQRQEQEEKKEKDWSEYTQWLNRLSKEAIQHFLRAIQIGVQLNESWLVCQGAAYTWNYLHHIFEKQKYSQVNHILMEVYEAIKKVGHST
jgi:hypothetical protein